MTNKKTVRFFNKTQSLIQGNPDLRDPQVEGWFFTPHHFRNKSENAVLKIPMGCVKTDLIAVLPYEIVQKLALVIVLYLEIHHLYKPTSVQTVVEINTDLYILMPVGNAVFIKIIEAFEEMCSCRN